MSTDIRTLAIGLILVVSVYGYFIQPYICQKKLREYAKKQNGHLIKSTNVSIRENIYAVYIEIDGQTVKYLVQFSFFNKMTLL